MSDALLADKERLLAEAAPVVRAILARKSGMSLAPDDARRDNVDALELCQDVLARLWERLAGESGGGATAPEVRDFRGYAATVAYNAWSDHLREKYPRRTSLKNRLRYFLGHQGAYALWQDAEGELQTGLAKWQLGARGATGERVAALREGRDRLPAGSVPRQPMERFAAADWDRLLAALFGRLGGPVGLDDLVGIVAELIGLAEERVDSLDEEPGEDMPARELADREGAPPDRTVELRRALARLWAAVRALKPDYRVAYLLNIPGPGKSRGDIDVFPLNGVASIAEIGAAIGLTDGQFRTLWDGLELAAGDRGELASLATPEAQFCLLWKYLPLPDALIGRVLGLEPQQVINRRMLALRELARALDDGSGAQVRGRG
jgi:RNA polymerase sigma factor (sigma-70 family)